MWITDQNTWMYVVSAHIANDSLLVAIYLPTIAVVLNTPMVRFFKSLPGVLIPVVIGLGGVGVTLFFPELVIGEAKNVGPGQEGVAPFWGVAGPL